MEKDEEKQPAMSPLKKVIGSKASLLISRSMLKVHSAAVGYLVYVSKDFSDIRLLRLTQVVMVACLES
jgi:hypothetical protein